MLSNVLIVLIVIGGVILAWPLMSAIFYLVVFLKAFIHSFRNLDVNQQVQATPNVSIQLKSKNSDNQLEIDFIVRMINKDKIVETLNNLKKGNSKNLRTILYIEESVSHAQHINSRKAYIKMFENMYVPANRTKPDIHAQGIKLPVLYSNSMELTARSAQN